MFPGARIDKLIVWGRLTVSALLLILDPADAPLVNYKKPGFLGKFLELNKVMWTTNAGLTDSHPYDSRPSSWPILKRGISFWGKDQKHIYLIGNWFTWYMSTGAVVLYVAIRAMLFIRDKRGYRDDFKGKKAASFMHQIQHPYERGQTEVWILTPSYDHFRMDSNPVLGVRDYYESSGGFFFMAWALHFLPFFLMDRQLFLHHYLPALYFAILLFSVTFDVACRFVPSRIRLVALIITVSIAVFVFRTRAPLTYGLEWTRAECEASKVLRTWDYDCNQYPASYAQYVTNVAASASNAAISAFDPPANSQGNEGESVLKKVVPAAEVQGVDLGEDTAKAEVTDHAKEDPVEA